MVHIYDKFLMLFFLNIKKKKDKGCVRGERAMT